jgi:glycosyltransferase involved in cell wall biosynthesis
MSASDRVVVLGRAMADRVEAVGALHDRIEVIPNWVDGDLIKPAEPRSSSLRLEFAGEAGFLAMYSGNIGRAHDVETLIGAVRILGGRADIGFVFVGEGARKTDLQAGLRGLPNVRFATYQPRERLADSLAAADVHLVTLVPQACGLLEPYKAHGAMAAGRPVLFVGPASSELAATIQAKGCGRVLANGDAAGLAAAIAGLAEDHAAAKEMGRRAREAFERGFERKLGVARFAEMLRLVARTPAKDQRNCVEG